MLSADDPQIIHATECLAAGTLAFLVQATRELAEAGARQTLVFSRRPDTPADVASLFDHRVELVEIAPPGGLHVRYLRDLRRAVLRPLQDVRQCGAAPALVQGRLPRAAGDAGPARRPRIFYSPHGLSFLNRRQRLRSAAFRSLEWLAARVDATLVGCSRSEAALLGRVGRRPARVLENAVDDSFFAVRGTKTRRRWWSAMGRVCFQKAPERFAHAGHALSHRRCCRRASSGSATAMPRARRSCAPPGVEVTGWVGRDEVQRLLGRRRSTCRPRAGRACRCRCCRRWRSGCPAW